MISRTTKRFREAYKELPLDIKRKAKGAYRLFLDNPRHPGLRYKQVHAAMPVYSVRITIEYRAVGIIQNGTMIWFWIGKHDEYERMIARL